jgi:prepilin-type processing-associated H-X9-DG protein
MKRVWVALSLFGSITLALSCEAVPEKAMPKPANDPVQLARDREVSLRWLDRLARVAKEGRYPDIAQRVERAKRFNSATPSTRCFLLAALTRDGKLNRHPVILVYFFNRLGDAKGIALLGRDKKQLASGPIPAEALGGVGNIPCGLLIVNVYPHSGRAHATFVDGNDAYVREDFNGIGFVGLLDNNGAVCDTIDIVPDKRDVVVPDENPRRRESGTGEH